MTHELVLLYQPLQDVREVSVTVKGFVKESASVVFTLNTLRVYIHTELD